MPRWILNAKAQQKVDIEFQHKIGKYGGIFRTQPNIQNEAFCRIVNGGKPWMVFAKRSILDVWQNFEYVYNNNK